MPRDADEYDEQVLRLATTGGPAQVVQRCREVLDAGELPDGLSRAFVLVQLGEYSDLAGDHDAAREAFIAAVAEPEPAHPDARAYLAGWHFEHGDPADGHQLIDAIWSERPSDPDVYLYIGELFELRDELPVAGRWLTTGAMRALRDDDVPMGDVAMLLTARRRVRLAQGFTEDDYDVMAGELRDQLYNR